MTGFDDLLDANRAYADSFTESGLEAPARAHVAVVTCMDSRIDPLSMLGLGLGDAKVIRNPGGRVTDDALEAIVLAVNLLGATRVMVVPHTRCAVASNTEQALRDKVAESAGIDASWQRFHVTDDQQAAAAADVARVRTHPLVPGSVEVGAFLYDVDSGLLSQLV